MKKGNIIYWIVILLWIFILIIIGIRKYNEYFNPVVKEAWLINPYFMVDQSGNQNHLSLPENVKHEYLRFDGVDDYLSTDIIVGHDYLFMGDTITVYPNFGYSASSINYMIFSVNVFTVYEVNKIFKELEKRWGERESIIIKPDSLENQLFKIN